MGSGFPVEESVDAVPEDVWLLVDWRRHCHVLLEA